MKTSTLINVVTYTVLIPVPVLVWVVIHFEPGKANAKEFDPLRYMSAVQKYSENLTELGAELPGSISMKELLQKGYVTSQEFEPFSDVEFYFHTNVDGHSLGSVLVEAHMPDGTVYAALNDGSVQHVSQTRWKEIFPDKSQSVDR
jgi:hypothetical protein